MEGHDIKRPDLCIFDLDGTLVDSLRDIAEAFNECLELLGLPPREISAYRYLVGEGIVKLSERAVGHTHPHLVRRLVELARPRYRLKCLVHTRPYRGIPELARSLAASGMKMAVLSNKPHEMTTRISREFWGADVFPVVQGYDREENRKPSPHHVLRICRHCGVEPSRTLLIGDTPTDIQTARNSGAAICSVTWGFRPREELLAAGADWIIDEPEEMSAALTAAAPPRPR